MMALLVGMVFATAVTAAPGSALELHRYRKAHHRVHAAAKPAASVTEEPLMRGRIARMVRLALLERRQAILEKFVRQAATETPAFRDDREVEAGAGIIVGPAIVAVDFLGSPVVRARVRNGSSEVAAPLLEALFRSADGREARALVAVGPLEPGATRTVELASPSSLVPVSLRWHVISL